MKKILSICFAAAMFVGCTNTEVEYDNTSKEIGFTAVSGNLTRAVVDGVVYPTTLNMYVYSWTNGSTAVDYINKGEFVYRTTTDGTAVWGGQTPYFWPNVKTLHFAGVSASGNVATATTSYDVATDVITVEGYTPGTSTAEGGNDLMYFPSTAATKAAGYDKTTTFVPVAMYHTCSWLTFLVKGDAVTGASGSTYKVTGLTVTGIDDNADVTCSAANAAKPVTWAKNEDGKTATCAVTNGGLGTLTTTAINFETAAEYVPADGTTGNVVVIPQVPGKLTLTYSFESSTGATITEEVTDLDLKVDDDATKNKWEPGKHYVYTITIKANEILIAPTPVDWVESPDHNITIE